MAYNPIRDAPPGGLHGRPLNAFVLSMIISRRFRILLFNPCKEARVDYVPTFQRPNYLVKEATGTHVYPFLIRHDSISQLSLASDIATFWYRELAC